MAPEDSLGGQVDIVRPIETRSLSFDYDDTLVNTEMFIRSFYDDWGRLAEIETTAENEYGVEELITRMYYHSPNSGSERVVELLAGYTRSGRVLPPGQASGLAQDSIIESAAYEYDGVPGVGNWDGGHLVAQHVCEGMAVADNLSAWSPSTVPPGCAPHDVLSWSFEHNIRGVRSKTIDERGATSTVTQFDASQLLPTEVEGPLGYVTSSSYDELGRPISTTDPNGVISQTVYDSWGREIATYVTPAGVGTSFLLAETEYSSPEFTDAGPKPLRVISRSFDESGAPISITLDFLDGTGEPQVRYTPHPDPAYGYLETYIERDIYGRETQVSHPNVQPVLPFAKTTATIANGGFEASSKSDFDGLGRPVKTWTNVSEDPDAFGTMSYPSANESVAVDPVGFVRRSKMDAMGRLKQVWEYHPTPSETDFPPAVMQPAVLPGSVDFSGSPSGEYEWDPVGRVSSYKDGEANLHLYSYDMAGRTRQIHRMGVSDSAPSLYRSVAYDGTYPLEISDSTRVLETWSNDLAGRLVSRSVFDDDLQDWVTYTSTYDVGWIGAVDSQSVSRPATPDEQLRYGVPTLNTETDFEYMGSQLYGNLGRPTQVTRTYTQDPRPLVYQSVDDLNGRLLSSRSPSGTATITDYHFGGAVDSVLVFDDTDGDAMMDGHEASHRFDNTYHVYGMSAGWRGTDLQSGASQTFGVLYERRDRVAATAYSDDGHLDPSRWANSLLSHVQPISTAAGFVSYQWLPNGMLSSRHYSQFASLPPELSYTYNYDAQRRVSRVLETNPLGTLVREQLDFDRVGLPKEHDTFLDHSGTHQWSIDPVDRHRFGEVHARRDLITNAMEFYEYDDESRVIEWATIGTAPNGAPDGYLGVSRSYFYDGASRLVAMESDDGHRRRYDYDLESEPMAISDGAGTLLERTFQSWHEEGGKVSEHVLPMLSVVRENGSVEFVYKMREPDGHVIRTTSGAPATERSVEVPSLYAERYYAFGQNWNDEALHGERKDPQTGLVQMGARHMFAGSGMWMQPEPLLGLSFTPEMASTPLKWTGLYAMGDPIGRHDVSGYAPSDEALNAKTDSDCDRKSNCMTFGGVEGDPNAAAIAGAAAGGADAVVDTAKFYWNLVTDTVETLNTLKQAIVVVATEPGVAWSAVSDSVSEAMPRDDSLPTAHIQNGAYATTYVAVSLVLPGPKAAIKGMKRLKAIAAGSCFVGATEVSIARGSVPLDHIRPGDMVLASILSESPDIRWTRVTLDPIDHDDRSAICRVCDSICHASRKLLLPAMLAGCGPTEVTEPPGPIAVAEVYDTWTGEWGAGVVGELVVGEEMLFDGHLFKLTDAGFEDRGVVQAWELSSADATFDAEAVAEVPNRDDWVLVLGDELEAGHRLLAEIVHGEQFAFDGRVYDAKRDETGLAIRATSNVLGKVVNNFVRIAPEVVDVTISYSDGHVDRLTGTPNHPFWVPAVDDYVALEDLEVGTVLRTYGGSEATVLGLTWKPGEVEVYDIEVEGLHNFLVRGPGSDAAGVLVHNSTGPKLLTGARIGHATPWAEMSAAQRKAFQHSYSRHAAELGLPNWAQSRAGDLQRQFNSVVGHIRANGQMSFTQRLHNGSKVDVRHFSATIDGHSYYYYETLGGQFISAGRF